MVDIDSLPEGAFVNAEQRLDLVLLRVPARADREELSLSFNELTAVSLNGEKSKVTVDALRGWTRVGSGRKVDIHRLRAGDYWVCRPLNRPVGVYIAPKNVTLTQSGAALATNSCVVLVGGVRFVVPLKFFKRLFVMLPNPVAAGKLKGVKRPRPAVAKPLPVANPVTPTAQTAPRAVSDDVFGLSEMDNLVSKPVVKTAPAFAKPVTSVAKVPLAKAPPPVVKVAPPTVVQSTQPAQPAKFIPTGRLVRNKVLVGLRLKAPSGAEKNVSKVECVKLAGAGRVENVKAVTRNGSDFLQGVGFPLDSLPEINF
jgi:hypothetical protein